MRNPQRVLLCVTVLLMLPCTASARSPLARDYPPDLVEALSKRNLEALSDLQVRRLREHFGDNLAALLEPDRARLGQPPGPAQYIWISHGECGYVVDLLDDLVARDWKLACPHRLVLLARKPLMNPQISRAPEVLYPPNPLPDFLVYVPGTPTSFFTDADGRFVGFAGGTLKEWWNEAARKIATCE